MRNQRLFSNRGLSVFLLCIVAPVASSRAEDAGGGLPPGRPPLTPFHWWEDFGFLKEPQEKLDQFDPLKFIPLTEKKEQYFTLGLDYRQRYESYSNEALGNGPAKDSGGYFLERLLLHGDLRLASHFRIYTELKSSWEESRRGPTRPIDEDRLDLLAGFVEAGCDLGGGKSLDFRIGRQEMHYGSGRVIDIREGPNNRQSFDEAKMLLNLGNWQVDAFFGRPVKDKVGVFDNQSSHTYDFAGVYATCRQLPLIKGAGLDLYALRDDVEKIPYFSGVKNEHRETFGIRMFGEFKNFRYDIEPTYQIGEFGHESIGAWATSNEVSYTFAKLPMSPQLDLHADAFSGDHSATDRNLNTYNALFPRGSYLSEPSPIGKQNLIDLRPAWIFHPRKDMTLEAANIFYWRQTIHDGTYYFANFPMFAPTNRHRYIGSESVINYEYRPNLHTTFNIGYSHFLAGDFIKQSPRGKDFDFIATWVTFRF